MSDPEPMRLHAGIIALLLFCGALIGGGLAWNDGQFGACLASTILAFVSLVAGCIVWADEA